MFNSSLFTLHRLRKQQWLRTEELEKIQRTKLRRIVKHAYDNVKYYRKLFDSVGIRPEHIKTVEDLTKIPITTKLQLQKLPLEEIVAKGTDLNKCEKLTTSGSTGIPLTFFLTKKDHDFYNMVWARASLENGQRLWDRTAYLKIRSLPKFWFQYLGIWRRHVVSYANSVEKQIEDLLRIKPHVIRGYSTKLLPLAWAIKKEKIKGLNPRLLFSMGHILDCQSRQVIESAFGTKIFDYYGAVELGCIAWECSEHRGYHINSDALVLELVKDGRTVSPGEMGKIICTGLHCFAMPLIRYDIGDIAIASHKNCKCGRILPLLKSIEGRADDFFMSQSGNLFPSPGLLTYMRVIPGISQFRIIQESLKNIKVQIVPDSAYSEKTKKRVKETMSKRMGKDFDIEVVVVDRIPQDPAGKIRSIISKVDR